MDPQTGLSRVLLFLLFLYLCPLGGRSYPLAGSGLRSGSDHHEQGLKHLPQAVLSKRQSEQMEQKHFQQRLNSTEGWGAMEANPAADSEATGPGQKPKEKTDSDCSEGKRDGMGTHSDPECKVPGKSP